MRTGIAAVACAVWFVLSNPCAGWAQDAIRPTVSFTIGETNLYEEPDYYVTVGGTFMLPLFSRFALQGEVDQILGERVTPVTTVRRSCSANVCGDVPFSFRSGVSSMGAATVNVVYYFPTEHAQAFVGGGVGVAWEEGVKHCISLFCRDRSFPDATVQVDPETGDKEIEYRRTALAVPVFGGVRIPLTSRLSVAPQLRFHAPSFELGEEADTVNSYPFSRWILRLSVAVGYSW